MKDPNLSKSQSNVANKTDYNIIYIGEEPDFKEFHVYCAVDPINFTHAVEI